MSRVTVWWATSVEELAPILDGWTRLSATLGKPLSSPLWLLNWWAERPDPRWRLRVLVAEEERELAAIVPLYSEGHPERLRLLGQPTGLWGCGPLLSPTSSPAVPAAIVRELARARPQEIRLNALGSREAAVVERLAALWPWPGVRVVVTGRDAVSGLRLAGTFEGWLASRNARWRTRLRRNQRGLLEAGGRVRFASNPAELVADLETLLGLHRLRWKEESEWLTPQTERMLQAVVRDPSLDGGVRIQTVEIGGRPVFAILMATLGGTLVEVCGGFDREFERFGLGILSHTAAIEEAFRRGDEFFDFGWGGRDHKSRYADDFEDVAWVELQPRAVRYALPPPTGEPRARGRSARDGRITIALGAEVVGPLRDSAAAMGTTLPTTLLAALQVVLSRWSGHDDVVIGASVGGGARGEPAGSLAGREDTVFLRTSLEGGPLVRELIARVRAGLEKAGAARSQPGDDAGENGPPEQGSGGGPPWFVLVRWLDPADPALAADAHPGVDLELRLWSAGDGLSGEAVFAADVVDAPTVDRLLGHWEVLLRGIAADPDRRITELPMLTPAELRQVAVDWNDTWVDYPRHEPLPRLFEAVVDRAPEAIALVADGLRTTYRELDERANRLANHLTSLGIVPGEFVGLALPRSADFVVAVLAILKAGGAYVPFGRDYPPERQRGIASDAGIRLVVCNAATAPVWHDTGIVTVDIAADAAAIDASPSVRPAAAADAAAPAYVMYTSGSTGRPKGVVIPHRGVTRLVLGTDFLPWGPDLRFLLLAPTAFDASTLELWGPLLHGATLVVHSADEVDPHDLGRLLERERVTCLWLTAALFNRIIDDRPSVLSPVRHLMTGGEPLSTRHVLAALECLPETRIINGYGPTETTTFATTHEIGRAPPPAADQPIPIGRPIANTRCIVLDANQQPVPVGVVGELWIGGDGVGLGYLGDAERTAEKFVALPFGPGPGERWYRTGDRVRWRPDGVLECLGRTDDQVKIRGFRVEPGEVAAALMRHPAVREAVVVAREDVPGEKRLVAYLVAEPGIPPPMHADVCAFLRATLPVAMIPAASVVLPSLPLSPNGKVDRKALPRPEAAAAAHDGSAAPRTEMEAELCRIWERLFGRSPIGRDDDFFALGGDSLLAIRMATELERLLGRRVPVAVVFEAPTVAALARWSAATPASSAPARSKAIVPLAARGGGTPVFLAHGVRGDVFHFAGLARLLAARATVYGLQARDRDGRYPPTLEDLCAEYVAEIRAVAAAGHFVIGGYSLGGWVAFETARQLSQAGERVTLLLFDVFPLCRVSWPAKAAARMCWMLYEAVSIGTRSRLYARRFTRMPAREWPAAAARLARPFARRIARMIGRRSSDNSVGVRAVPASAAGGAAPDPLFPLVAGYEARPFAADAVVFRSSWLAALPLPLFWRLLLGRRVRAHRLRHGHYQLFDADSVSTLASLVRESLPDAGPDRPRG